MSEAMSGQEVAPPDRTGVVLGYRTWRLVSEQEGLWSSSIILSSPWRPDAPTEAVCYNGPGCSDPPSWHCRCGLYANILPHENGNIGRYNVKNVLVYGAVLAWGRVIFHADESFIRAQKMLPIAFMQLPHYQMQRLVAEGAHSYFHQQYALSTEKLSLVSDALGAPIFSDSQALQDYAEAEKERW